jgi:hypothetical protein
MHFGQQPLASTLGRPPRRKRKSRQMAARVRSFLEEAALPLALALL